MISFVGGGFDPFDFGTGFNAEGPSFVMRTFTDEARPNVKKVAFSQEYRLPTVQLESGDIVQFIYDPVTLRISKIRALPTAHDPALVVQTIMSALLVDSGGDLSAIDPATIGFGETERFQQTYKGEWEAAYRRYKETNSLAANPFTSRGKSDPVQEGISNLRVMTPRGDAEARRNRDYDAA